MCDYVCCNHIVLFVCDNVCSNHLALFVCDYVSVVITLCLCVIMSVGITLCLCVIMSCNHLVLFVCDNVSVLITLRCFSAVVLIVVQSEERNIYDQRQLEYAAHNLQPRCRFIRRTIDELAKTAHLGENSALFV